MNKKKVMIVDDTSMMRVIVGNMFHADPYLCVAGYASNGKEALEKLPALKPDLILLDIEMPEMDGLEFLRHARLKCPCKIVVLSSVTPAGSPRAIQARMLGADAIISKPSGAVSYDLKEKRGSLLFQTIYKLLNITNESNS
ncbi:MAG TPA: response regulator [Anaerolineae bacterium]|nr:response regulator [Anaerolineae bacterium]HMR62488.1 response regulator [Anaerolineae bacterium]